MVYTFDMKGWGHHFTKLIRKRNVSETRRCVHLH